MIATATMNEEAASSTLIWTAVPTSGPSPKHSDTPSSAPASAPDATVDRASATVSAYKWPVSHCPSSVVVDRRC